jgi:GGDEF domain-containing protein
MIRDKYGLQAADEALRNAQNAIRRDFRGTGNIG